jgi:ribosomal protein S18 acetylase RimI-like enzyme
MNFDLVIFKVTVFFQAHLLKRVLAMIDYNIRNIVEEDFNQLSCVAEKCQPMTNMKPTVYHVFTKHFKGTSFVIENKSNNAITGFLLGLISQDNPNDSYIHLICLDPSLRGKGVAKTLVEKFIQTVSNRGCSRVCLVTKPHNHISIKFYTKLGFESYNSDKTVNMDGTSVYKDYDGPGDDKIIFIKQIS